MAVEEVLRLRTVADTSGFGQVEHAYDRMGRANRQFTNQLMVTGQLFDDLQYVGEQGLRPIVNNLMQLSPLVGFVAIGANLLYTNWDSVAKLWGQGHTETEAQRMERLGKATDEASKAELELMKAQQARREAVAKTPSEADRAAAGSATATIKDLGGSTAQQQVFEALRELSGPGNPIRNPDADPKLREAEEARLQTMATDLVGELARGGEKAAAAARVIEDMAARLGRPLLGLGGTPESIGSPAAGTGAFSQSRVTVDELIRIGKENEAILEIQMRQAKVQKEIQASAEAAAKAVAQQQLATKEAKDERILNRAADMYGQGFGGNIQRAMMRAGAKGEDSEAVDARLSEQLQARMLNLPPALRAAAAQRVIDQSRQMVEDRQAGMLAGQDIMAANLAGMTEQRGRMGIMQRQFLGRAVGEMQRSMQAGVPPEQQAKPEVREQVQAARSIKEAAELIEEASRNFDRDPRF